MRVLIIGGYRFNTERQKDCNFAKKQIAFG